MRQILTIIGVFIILNSFGQNYDLELILRPSFSNKITHGKDKELKNMLANTNFSLTIDYGAVINKNLNEKSKLGVGVLISNYGTFYSYDSYELNYKSRYRLNYFSIPLIYTRKINENKIITLGIGNNILFKTKEKLTYQTEGINDTTVIYKTDKLKEMKYNLFNPSLEFAYGWIKSINDNYSFILQPNLSVLLFDSQKGGSLTNTYYKIGLNIKLLKN